MEISEEGHSRTQKSRCKDPETGTRLVCSGNQQVGQCGQREEPPRKRVIVKLEDEDKEGAGSDHVGPCRPL